MNKRSIFLLGTIVGGTLTLAMAPQCRKEIIQRFKKPFKSQKLNQEVEEAKQSNLTRERLEDELDKLSQRVEALL